MLWFGLSLVGVALLVAIVMTVRRNAGASRPVDDVDPVFTAGIALTGAGVALSATIGNVMFVVMTVGLIVMAVGAHRTQQQHHE